MAAVVCAAWHGARMARIIAGNTAAVATMLLAAGTAPAAPGPAPVPPSPGGGFGSGWAQCGDQMVPADPRVDMSNPLGGLIYRRMLEAMCGNEATQ